MLVLSRKRNEKIVLPTMNVAIQVVGIKGRVVRLGIHAPKEVPVLREEIPDRAAEWGENQTRHADRQDEQNPSIFSRPLCDGLKSTAAGLGLLRLQLDTGETEEARATLACIQHDFQFLCYGVEGEMEGTSVGQAIRTPKPRKARHRNPRAAQNSTGCSRNRPTRRVRFARTTTGKP